MAFRDIAQSFMALTAAVALWIGTTHSVRADGAGPGDGTEIWSLHAQATFVEQYHPRFRSPYRGINSLDPGSRGNESVDLTIFAGLHLWPGGEAYADPEIDQGFGLSDTVGVAGFPSGETGKVGSAEPYFRLQRLFFRQTFNLGGTVVKVDGDSNQLAGSHTVDNVVVTLGKFDVTDVFDTNAYAHDTKNDFLNWSIIDAGAFDYAADSWGYTYGIATEWTQSWWTLRAGLFDLSKIPNLQHLETGFAQFEIVGEFEERHEVMGRDGKLKLLGFVNRGRMGDYNDALDYAAITRTTPSTAAVRNYASRPGLVVNFAQSITETLGAFARASLNDGSKEAYEYTEINRSVSAGLSLAGASWGRANDTVGAAVSIDALSAAAKRYFAAGGVGILIGDGRLPHYGTENILEFYYRAQIAASLSATADYQLIDNPAYNRDRGPVSVLGARIHAQI